MSKSYYFDKKGSFIINNYNRAYPMFNFLPGIAGPWGIPLWAFYVNRAQGIVSFGVHDKSHSILEFYPADRALRTVGTTGFRTFIKIDDRTYYEPFQPNPSYFCKEKMCMDSSTLKIEELSDSCKLKTFVKYFSLTECPFASLVRVLKVKNLSRKLVHLQIIDGLVKIIPFGARNIFLKNLSHTLQAWMYSKINNNIAEFKLLANPKDASQIKSLKGANFNYAFYDEAGLKHPEYIIDPYALFSMDTSFEKPLKFLAHNFKYPKQQITCGRAPSALSYFEWDLKKDEEKTFYSLWGTVFDKTMLKLVRKVDLAFINEKEQVNRQLIKDLEHKAFCLSSDIKLNRYIGSSYLDNIMRGEIGRAHV